MYNDFVILGPPSDPAGIRGERGATAALRKIAAAQAAFVTRQFGVDRYGAALFFPNSDQWRQKHPRG